jgi:hypothetical protein
MRTVPCSKDVFRFLRRDSAMLKFTRTKYVGIERPERNRVVAHGILDDYIYGMRLEVEFSLPEYEIAKIEGTMTRFTTPECPRANEILGNAVGMRIEPGLEDRIKKEIGRAGCRHYAALLIECCNSVVSASIGFARQDLEDEGLPTDDDAVRKRLFEMLPHQKGSCMAYS